MAVFWNLTQNWVWVEYGCGLLLFFGFGINSSDVLEYSRKSFFIVSQLPRMLMMKMFCVCLFVCFGVLQSSLRERALEFYGPVCTKGHVEPIG